MAKRGGLPSAGLLVSQFFLGDDHLLHMPVSLPLHFLAIFGGVAQANTSNIPQVFERKLKFIDAAPKKQTCNSFSGVGSGHRELTLHLTVRTSSS